MDNETKSAKNMRDESIFLIAQGPNNWEEKNKFVLGKWLYQPYKRREEFENIIKQQKQELQ